jgi:hypothetical protein
MDYYELKEREEEKNEFLVLGMKKDMGFVPRIFIQQRNVSRTCWRLPQNFKRRFQNS